MSAAGILGLASKDVEAALSFVLGRASAHDEQEGGPREVSLHRLCAATLRRDAAALAILLDDYEKARFLLSLAGTEYVEEQAIYGLTLLSVTDGNMNMEGLQLPLARFAEEDDEQEAGADVSGDGRRRIFSSRVERVSALQALSLIASRDPFEEASRIRLSRDFQQFPVAGASPELGTPFYFRLLDQVSSVDAAPPQYPSRDLYALSAVREGELRAAQADEYHWPMLLNPSDLVGFDVMFLALAALRHDRPLDPLLNAFGSLESPLAFPIMAAERLAASTG